MQLFRVIQPTTIYKEYRFIHKKYYIRKKYDFSIFQSDY